MDIKQAIPIEKYSKAAAHAQTSEFKRKRDEAIYLIREWRKSKIINHKFPPAIMFSYGKDSSAVNLLYRMAEIPFVTLTIDNGGDLPIHYDFYEEWNQWFGNDFVKERIVLRSEERYIDYKYNLIQWGRLNNVRKKDGSLVDFFDMASLHEAFEHRIIRRFENIWAQDQENVLICWADRGSEAMYKFFQIKTYGVLHRWGGGRNEVPYFQGEPIGWWKDIDVWALLVSENVPVSPIYSMHELPQRPGKNAFPQTLWYASANHMSSTFYNWMAKYAPLQLKEMLELFPEIPIKLREKKKKAKAEATR